MALTDPVAQPSRGPDRFESRVEEQLVDNGRRGHRPEPHLNSRAVGEAASAALTIGTRAHSFGRPTSRSHLGFPASPSVTPSHSSSCTRCRRHRQSPVSALLPRPTTLSAALVRSEHERPNLVARARGRLLVGVGRRCGPWSSRPRHRCRSIDCGLDLDVTNLAHEVAVPGAGRHRRHHRPSSEHRGLSARLLRPGQSAISSGHTPSRPRSMCSLRVIARSKRSTTSIADAIAAVAD